MSSFNESVGLGYLKTHAIEFVKYPNVLNGMDDTPKEQQGALQEISSYM